MAETPKAQKNALVSMKIHQHHTSKSKRAPCI